jgi:hypothetical protein
MTPDAVLIVVLTALGAAAVPFLRWLRARKRIRDLEMALLVQTTDGDRCEEPRALLQQVAAQTDHLANAQAQLARRPGDRLDQLPPLRAELRRSSTPH